MIKNKRILITGSRGFIGSTLAKRLIVVNKGEKMIDLKIILAIVAILSAIVCVFTFPFRTSKIYKKTMVSGVITALIFLLLWLSKSIPFTFPSFRVLPVIDNATAGVNWLYDFVPNLVFFAITLLIYNTYSSVKKRSKGEKNGL